MRNAFLNLIIVLFTFSCLNFAYSEDQNFSEVQNLKTEDKNLNNNEINLFTGVFDFSDQNQKSNIFGLQHQNDDLFRNSFLGRLTPITGGWLTDKQSVYLYTGAQAEYNFGLVTITPSFAPGYYNAGDSKDLGHELEFKSEIQMSLNLSEDTQFGMSYNHISNARLGDKNPGANSYMINFLKQF